MSVGDINSTERGSGARFNDGKPDLSLIPLSIIASSFGSPDGRVDGDVLRALQFAGEFQATGNLSYLDIAIQVLRRWWPECAHVITYGAKKYAPWNWAKGMAWSIPLACIGRHSLAILEDSQQADAETGRNHRGHILANLMFLRHYVTFFPEGNDLPDPKLFTPGALIAGGPLIHSPEDFHF